MSNPGEDLVDHITGSLGLTKQTNLFYGPMRKVGTSVPVNAVFINSGAGAPPSRVMSERFEVRNPVVAIRVRWSNYSDGAAKAKAVQNFLQGASVSGYLDIRPLQSEPTYIEINEQGHHLWTMSYVIAYERDNA
jgi:hypothetical protein